MKIVRDSRKGEKSSQARLGALACSDWYLNADDAIEAEVENIGTLVNAVVDELQGEPHAVPGR